MWAIFSASSTPHGQYANSIRVLTNERTIIAIHEAQGRELISLSLGGLVHYDGAALSKALTSKPKHRTERVSRENRPARIVDAIESSMDRNTTLEFFLTLCKMIR